MNIKMFSQQIKTTVLALTAIVALACAANAQINEFGPDAGSGSGSANTANGFKAVTSETIGSDNEAYGNYALSSNTTGNGNDASGYAALSSNTNGFYNTAIRNAALGFN